MKSPAACFDVCRVFAVLSVRLTLALGCCFAVSSAWAQASASGQVAMYLKASPLIKADPKHAAGLLVEAFDLAQIDLSAATTAQKKSYLRLLRTMLQVQLFIKDREGYVRTTAAVLGLLADGADVTTSISSNLEIDGIIRGLRVAGEIQLVQRLIDGQVKIIESKKEWIDVNRLHLFIYKNQQIDDDEWLARSRRAIDAPAVRCSMMQILSDIGRDRAAYMIAKDFKGDELAHCNSEPLIRSQDIDLVEAHLAALVRLNRSLGIDGEMTESNADFDRVRMATQLAGYGRFQDAYRVVSSIRKAERRELSWLHISAAQLQAGALQDAYASYLKSGDAGRDSNAEDIATVLLPCFLEFRGDNRGAQAVYSRYTSGKSWSACILPAATYDFKRSRKLALKGDFGAAKASAVEAVRGFKPDPDYGPSFWIVDQLVKLASVVGGDLGFAKMAGNRLVD